MNLVVGDNLNMIVIEGSVNCLNHDFELVSNERKN